MNGVAQSLSDCWRSLPVVAWIERLVLCARLFLGVPYLLGACGEGIEGKFNQRPVIRVDAMDCLTYVNTVLALAHAESESNILPLAKELNYYQATIAFENRFHFFSLDWLTENQRAGFVLPIDDLGYPQKLAQADIDVPEWYAKRSVDDIVLERNLSAEGLQKKCDQLRALGQTKQKAAVSLPYYALADVLADNRLQALPPISLMVIVRPDWYCEAIVGTRLLVSHLGFVINDDGLLTFLHARQNESVCEVDLFDYLQAYQDHPTVKGVGFYKLP